MKKYSNGNLLITLETPLLEVHLGMLATVSRETPIYKCAHTSRHSSLWPTASHSALTAKVASDDSDIDESIQIINAQRYSRYAYYWMPRRWMPTEKLVLSQSAPLAINTEVLVSELPENPDYYHLAVFKRLPSNNPELPESGNEIKIIQEGFIDKHSVTLHEKLLPADTPLFPNKPCPKDIRQSTWGDCFLLSPLITISNKNPEFLLNCMRDLGSHVAVRLFDVHTRKPLIFNVPKIEYQHATGNANQHSALWVHMLELAYLSYGQKQSTKKNRREFSAPMNMYGSGGRSELAFTILTGEDAQEIDFNKLNTHYGACRFWDPQLFHLFLKVMLDETLSDKEKETAILEKFKTDFIYPYAEVLAAFGNEANIVEWVKYVIELSMNPEKKSAIKSAYGKPCFRADRQDFSQVCDIIMLLKRLPDSPEHIIRCFEDYINGKSATGKFPFRNYDEFGEYTALELKIYNDIFEQQEERLVTASTPAAKVHQTIPGLRSQHAYAIDHVFEKVHEDRELKFVRLYNPWGRVGTVCLLRQPELGIKEDTVKEDPDLGHFDLELSLFTRYFHRITFGSLPAQLEQDLSFEHMMNDFVSVSHLSDLDPSRQSIECKILVQNILRSIAQLISRCSAQEKTDELTTLEHQCVQLIETFSEKSDTNFEFTQALMEVIHFSLKDILSTNHLSKEISQRLHHCSQEIEVNFFTEQYKSTLVM